MHFQCKANQALVTLALIKPMSSSLSFGYEHNLNIQKLNLEKIKIFGLWKNTRQAFFIYGK